MQVTDVGNWGLLPFAKILKTHGKHLPALFSPRPRGAGIFMYRFLSVEWKTRRVRH